MQLRLVVAIMLVASTTKTMSLGRYVQKVLFVDRFQHFADGRRAHTVIDAVADSVFRL